jgi:peptidoglycan hydrolase-like protein with peptidoglycan-binding domain
VSRREPFAVGVAVTLGLSAVVVWAVAGGPLHHVAADAPTSQPGTGTAAVVRTDVAERQQVTGTLGYAGSAAVVAQRAGTLTWSAPPGTVVRSGQPVAEIDGRAVVLLLGARPAWRGFALGMSDGPDVRQLETALAALGYDPHHAMRVDAHFTTATAAAVRRWQRALGWPATGSVPLGDVAFLPRPLRVTSDDAVAGAPVSPGQLLVSGTTTDREVVVALDTARQGLVHVGDQVVVTLPDGRTTTRGRVSFVSRVATPADSGQGGTGGPGQGSLPTVQVVVTLADQRAAGQLDMAPVQVAVTDQLHRAVLAVPVTALLGTPGGGYAVTPAAGGADLPVSVGLFDDLTQLVEVSGPGVVAGLRVEVPQS